MIDKDLFLVSALSIVLTLVALIIPSSNRYWPLGIVFVVFSPGYSLVAALYPQKSSITTTYRLALSFGLSIIIVPLLMYLLDFARLGLHAGSVTISVCLFILVASLIGWYRRSRLPRGDRFSPTIGFQLPRMGSSKISKSLSILLGIVSVSAVIALGYSAVTPKTQQDNVEFYISGIDGGTIGLPEILFSGNEVQVPLGISNQTSNTEVFIITIMIDGVQISQKGPITIKTGETWEGFVSFTPITPRDKEEISFLLYKSSESNYLHRLYFWIDIKDQTQ
jgi:uncharacterized membrane protein